MVIWNFLEKCLNLSNKLAEVGWNWYSLSYGVTHYIDHC